MYLVPGVPREVSYLMHEVIGPRIDLGAPILHRRTLKVVGLGESRLEHEIREVVAQYRDRVRFGYRALGVENHIKLAARGESPEALFDEVSARLSAVLGDAIFGADDDQLVSVLHRKLVASGRTVAAAESCSGGLIAKMLTDEPGASAYFKGGVVAYDNRVKTVLLDVPASLIESEGAVSEVVARAMAEGARRRLGVDYALSATGIAGPEGGTQDKPVGTVFVALADAGETSSLRLSLPGDRATIRKNTAISVLDLLRRRLD
jgi:nicotinamide-nucleotide amidase